MREREADSGVGRRRGRATGRPRLVGPDAHFLGHFGRRTDWYHRVTGEHPAGSRWAGGEVGGSV